MHSITGHDEFIDADHEGDPRPRRGFGLAQITPAVRTGDFPKCRLNGCSRSPSYSSPTESDHLGAVGFEHVTENHCLIEAVLDDAVVDSVTP